MSDATDLTKSIGAPGLLAYGGRINDEYDARLRGDRLLKTYTEMGNDATIRSFLFAFDVLARAAGHRFEPSGETLQANQIADFFTDALDDMDGSFSDTESEILTCLQYGFSLFELIYKRRDDGKIGWSRWAPRAQETVWEWLWDSEWNVTGIIQNAPPSYQMATIPVERLLHFTVQPRKQNPMGASLLRAAYDSWYFTKHIQKIEAIGIERDLAGLPVIGIPDAAYRNETEVANWLAVGSDLRRDERAAVIKPNIFDDKGNAMYTVELLSTGGSRQIDTDPILARYERKMLRAVLADFLTLGDTGVGSYALGISRADLFLDAAKAVLTGIEDTINISAIPRLMALNGMPPELAPRFVFNEITQRDTQSFANTIAILATAGVVDITDPAVRRYVYKEIGLPIPDETSAEAEQDDVDAPNPVIPAVRIRPPMAKATDPIATLKRLPPSKTVVIAPEPTPALGEQEAETKDATRRAQDRFNAIVGPRFAGLLAARVETE